MDGVSTKKRIVVALDAQARREYLTERVRTDLDSADSFEWELVSPTEVREAIARQEADAVLLTHLLEGDALALARDRSVRVVAAIAADRFIQQEDLKELATSNTVYIDSTNGSSPAVAEWALALVLVALRRGGAHFVEMRSGTYTNAPQHGRGYSDGELSGKTIGLVGLGHIGRSLAKLLKPFNVDLRCFDPYVSPGLASSLDVKAHRELDDLFVSSQIVVVSCPLTEETRGSIRLGHLESMPEGGVFVNVGRGAVVGVGVIDRLLSSGSRPDLRIALDVFDPEPIPRDSVVLNSPSVFVSPHIAGVTQQGRERCVSFAIEQVLLVLDGFESSLELNVRAVGVAGRG